MVKQNPDNMSFLDHLEVLRWHLIRCIVAILIGTIGVFISKKFVFGTLIEGPRNPSFITYRLFCQLSKKLGLDESLCVGEMPFELTTMKMAEKFSLHMWTSITIGFIIVFPYVLWELWRFISPGLRSGEKKYSKGFIFIGSLLFFIGVLFGYYLIAPLSVNFLGGYELIPGNDITARPTMTSYIALLRSVVLSAGLIFELPIIIFFLTKVGLVTPEFLKKNRKVALVIVLIVSAIITPPDVASQIIVTVPVIILYEVSIIISRRIVKKSEAKAQLQ